MQAETITPEPTELTGTAHRDSRGVGDRDTTSERQAASIKRSSPRRSKSWVATVALAFALALSCRTWGAQVYSIPSLSMFPTLQESDRVLVSKLDTTPERGDVVVFDRGEPKALPDDPDRLIKRVIGLPGDRIETRSGRVYINGTIAAEPYLPAGTRTDRVAPTVVGQGEYFVMGDNRANSHDSRDFGTINRQRIVGVTVARIWPLSRIDTI